MPRFVFSQGETWARRYTVSAPTEKEAKDIYSKYLLTGEEPEDMYIGDPEFIGDNADDLIVYQENALS